MYTAAPSASIQIWDVLFLDTVQVSGVGYPTPAVFPPGMTAPVICDFLLSSRSAVFAFLANFFFAVFDNPLALPPPTSGPVSTTTLDA